MIIIIQINEVTIKNANLSPNLDKFAENFTEISISSLMNYFSKYDNFLNYAEFKNMTTIVTLLSFLRQTTLLQRAMNLIV